MLLNNFLPLTYHCTVNTSSLMAAEKCTYICFPYKPSILLCCSDEVKLLYKRSVSVTGTTETGRGIDCPGCYPQVTVEQLE